MPPSPVYDVIGRTYNSTRAADPYLTSRILEHLVPVPSGRYLDIGCGTGNYLWRLTRHGLLCTGVDPSATMLRAARAQCPEAPLVRAAVEQLPLRDGVFDGAIGILTTHHWAHLETGLGELARVLRPGAKLVLFTVTPQQLLSYWLAAYFPTMIARAAAGVPDLPTLRSMLHRAGFDAVATEAYSVRDDLQDHFLYAHKHDPAQYLRPEVRDGMSAFRLLAGDRELTDGLTRLQADLASGSIREVMAHAALASADGGDYLFVVATVISGSAELRQPLL